MNGSIYLIKNSKNNKVYIGQTIQDVEKRFKQHLKLLKTNKNQAISNAIKSIGKENFSYETLITGITTYEELNELEELYIQKYNSIVPNGYNLCPGGQKWRRTPEFTKEQEIEVVEKYQSGMSARKVAELYGVSHHTVLDVLKGEGIKSRPKTVKLPDRTSKLTKEIMEDLYVNKGMRMKDIAELLNVNVRTVNRAKNRYNLERI